MDMEVLPDSYLLTIASAYVPQTIDNQIDFADLSREAPDIYHLVYHPTFDRITRPQREQSKATLETILFACLNHADLDYDVELASAAKLKFATERVKQIKLKR